MAFCPNVIFNCHLGQCIYQHEHEHQCAQNIGLITVYSVFLQIIFLNLTILMKKGQSGDQLIIRNFDLMKNAKFCWSQDEQIF